MRASDGKEALMARSVWIGVCLGFCSILGGCHHRQAAATLPPVLKAPDLQPPAPNSPPMQSPPPDSASTAPQVKVTEAKPKRTPKKAAPKTPAVDMNIPPAEVASSGPTPEGSIGELSAGGDATPKRQQAAAELIIACEQRLNDSQQHTKEQQPTLRQVRNFIKQSKQALSSGDAEGALTLATKAKLLLDDLVKDPT